MSHWSGHAKQWDRVGPPLRPSPEVVACIQQGLLPSENPVLILGVTPEMTEAFARVIAVDRNPEMLHGLWKKDSSRSRAVCADWLSLEPSEYSYAAAIGDGCFTVLGSAIRAEMLMARLASILDPGTPLRFRLFIRPEMPWSLNELITLTQQQATINFHAFKWMISMHLAARHGDQIGVKEICEFFNTHWPERQALCEATGWNPNTVATIDVYRDSSDMYWFPTVETFKTLADQYFLDTAIISCGTYDLAEQCPVFFAQAPGR